jgi:hypothetical protein
MMNQKEKEGLDLKVISPYMPYGLKFMITSDNVDEDFVECDFPEGTCAKGTIWDLFIITTDTFDFWGGDCEYLAFKNDSVQISYTGGIHPILRPLSDLYSEDTDCGIKIVYWNAFRTTSKLNPMNFPYHVMLDLFKNHFDVFGLIDKGLAVSIHDIKSA